MNSEEKMRKSNSVEIKRLDVFRLALESLVLAKLLECNTRTKIYKRN